MPKTANIRENLRMGRERGLEEEKERGRDREIGEERGRRCRRRPQAKP